MSKKIIFWSAVNPKSVLDDVISDLVSHGFDVEIKYLLEESAYRNSVGFVRSNVNKFIMYIIFPLYYIIFSSLFDRRSINVTTTNPFFLPFVAALLKRRASILIQLVWDLYPQAIRVNSDVNYLTSAFCYFIEFVVGFSLRHNNANVFISRTMLDSAKTTFDGIVRPVLIPVGASNKVFLNHAPRLCDGASNLNIIYCGNLGRMHDFSTFVDSLTDSKFSELCLSGLNVSFYSFGPNYIKLVDCLKNRNYCDTYIKLNGPLDAHKWLDSMQNSQISMISLAVGAECAALPSKTYSSLAAGHAILGVCSKHSELGRLIIENNCGWVVEPGDSNMFLATLGFLVNNPKDLFIKRCNAFKIGNDLYSSARVAKQWVELFNVLQTSSF